MIALSYKIKFPGNWLGDFWLLLVRYLQIGIITLGIVIPICGYLQSSSRLFFFEIEDIMNCSFKPIHDDHFSDCIFRLWPE